MFGSSRTLLEYSRRFERELPDRVKTTTKENLQKDIHKSSIVLFGDFHTLKQSQRGFLRTISSYRNKYRNKDIVIALEAFRSSDNRHLDDFLSDRISEDDFLKVISYNTYWSFPWANFKMILDFAKSFHIPVIGINSERGGKDSLFQRDRHIANQLKNQIERQPDAKIFCLIGEFHLSSQHLPAFIDRRLKGLKSFSYLLRITNNIDKYYFTLDSPETARNNQYLELKNHYYCIINTPPWIKWQSFNIWEETRNEFDLVDENFDELEGQFERDLLYKENNYDVDSHFHNLAAIISRFIGLNPADLDLYNFNIFIGSIKELDEYLRIFSTESLEKKRSSLARIDYFGCVFLPANNTILLKKISLNDLADMAGRFVHKQMLKYKINPKESIHQAFYRHCVISAIGFLSSKILNPKRKCQSLSDFSRELHQHKGKKTTLKSRLDLQVTRAIVQHEQWVQNISINKNGHFSRPISFFYHTEIFSNRKVSHAIGQAMGKAIYSKIMAGRVPRDFLFKIFQTPIDSFDSCWDLYLEFHRHTTKLK